VQSSASNIGKSPISVNLEQPMAYKVFDDRDGRLIGAAQDIGRYKESLRIKLAPGRFGMPLAV
jgi:hypothetical protein